MCLRSPCGQARSLVMGSLFGAWWSSLRTWPEIRKSNDLWPMSEPCCGCFHSSGLILQTNKCTARSHRSSRGCFLEVPLRASEAQCLGCAKEFLGETSAVLGPGILKMPFFLRGFWGGFLALAEGLQQMANWTSMTRPSGAILMPHMLHPAAMTSWRLLSHRPSQPSP